MRTLLVALAFAARAAAAQAGGGAAAAAGGADVLISGGTLYDGSGSPGRRADIALRGDRIDFIGDARAAKITAKRTIDATGLIVSPGFIDPHTHTQSDLSGARRANLNYIMQGVTTVVTNNDGSGSIHIGATLAHWDSTGIGTNALLFVPQGSVRGEVMALSDKAPTPAQLALMKALVERGMREGAFGMSTGLYYAPGSYSTTEEVIELAKVAAAHGGIYDTHQRDESSYTIGLLASVQEVLRIGKEAKIPVHISHIKALGADVWGFADTVIAMVHAAQRAGITVAACQYPYDASGTSLVSALVPRWAEANGRDSLLARIASPTVHARLAAEMRENLRRRGGAAAMLIVGGRDAAIIGKRLDAIAAARKTEPVEAALDIIRTSGDAGVASFNMNAKDMDTFMRADFVTTCSDGSDGHPRKFGTFPKKIRDDVLERHVITMERAIQSSTSQPARDMQISQRGKLEQGWFADVIVFDPKTIRDLATYAEPEKLATGMRWVFVNGKAAVEIGKPTNALSGKALRLSGGSPPKIGS